MDSAEFEFNTQAWFALLKNVKDRFKKLEIGKEFGGLIQATVFQDIMDHFKKEEGPDGPWKPWSKSYLQSIAGLVAFRTINGRVVPITSDKFLSKNKPPRKPGLKLQNTGKLRNSFKPGNWKTVTGGVLFYNDAKTKSGFPYASAHDKGGDKLPKRSFMWLSKKGHEAIAERVSLWILDGVKK